MGGWSNSFFDGLLALAALWGAMRFYAMRQRDGMRFGAAALAIVFLASLFGVLRYGGVTAAPIVAANDGLSLIAAIAAPTWAIAAILLAFRGGQNRARLAILWIVPVAVAVLAFLPATAMLGEVYSQIAGLAMVVMLVGAGVIAAIRNKTVAGVALAFSAAGYALAALVALNVFDQPDATALDIFHIGIAVWAAAFAFGLTAASHRA
ncbi:MAG: hypothetical protein CVT73_04100 [Alphaproteobacteria bacterium HGW-Alphaproteobacteria-12]|nr:MAG: hypothetical protein CVT73_04100 [Alphaproteobacteria bacterium HGW-Alphaproteobacteria-12]